MISLTIFNAVRSAAAEPARAATATAGRSVGANLALAALGKRRNPGTFSNRRMSAKCNISNGTSEHL